jgi:ribosomal protein S18 acetylase RimI-like enzyme
MTIRQALPADRAAVDAITQRAYAHYLPVLGHAPMPLVADYAERIGAGEVWLLERAGTPLALAVIEAHPDHIHIFSLAVDPDAQHGGLGRELLAFAEERARAAGIGLITLVTNARMERNIGIYRRAGYVETHRAPHPVHPTSTTVFMEKPLGIAENRRSA